MALAFSAIVIGFCPEEMAYIVHTTEMAHLRTAATIVEITQKKTKTNQNQQYRRSLQFWVYLHAQMNVTVCVCVCDHKTP